MTLKYRYIYVEEFVIDNLDPNGNITLECQDVIEYGIPPLDWLAGNDLVLFNWTGIKDIIVGGLAK